MNIKRYMAAVWLIFSLCAVVMTGCTVKYSFSGASISPLAQTVSIAYFPNNATMVAPTLSATFTEALKDKFARQTRLSQVNEGGDLHFEGEIINYVSAPSSVVSSGTDEYAAKNRLTITVRVTFVNEVDPEWSFPARNFSAFTDYDSNVLLTDVENQLIAEIVEILVDDIFNAAVANW